MKMLFTKLSSRCSQLRSAAFCLILEWNFSSDSLCSCLQLKKYQRSNVSFLTSLNVSFNCSTFPSVVHLDISVWGFL